MNLAPFAFESAPQLTWSQAELLNWFHRIAPEASAWRRLVRAAFAETLETPAPPEVWLVETHCLGQREPIRHPIKSASVVIGRSEEAGIVASAPAIAREHALLRSNGAACTLEDLDSKIGTFLTGRRLAPGKPEAIRHGDRFTIFPYNYELQVEQRWMREENVDLMAGPAVPSTYAQFRSPSGAGRFLRGLVLEPFHTGVVLDLGSAFVTELARRALHPVPAGAHLGELEQAAAEYLLINIAEVASRDFAFPFTLGVLRAGALPDIADSEAGVALACTIGISQLSGVVRVFVPQSAVRLTQPANGVEPPVTWSCAVLAGSLELSAAELRSLEPGDVLLYTPAAQLRLPGGRIFWRGELADMGNFRITLTENSEEPTMSDERLDELPVRLNIIVGERELTLAGLRQLSRGSIVELDRGPSDPVQIALNGRIAGQGELVRIEDKLGVRILSWKEPTV